MPRAYLGLGSNLGDKRATIAAAIARLEAEPGITLIRRSGDYRTLPWGETDQDWFVNACVSLETSLSPQALLRACLTTEGVFGRVRTRRWGPRTLDIDLLQVEGEVSDTANLTLPHPYLLERAFVLVPLSEIAPDLVIGGRSIAAALAALDRSGIRRLD